MKKSLFIALAVLSTIAISCFKLDDVLYSETTIGNISGGKFVTDAGLTYTFTEQACAGRIDTLSRIIAVCDVLEQTSETAYNARLVDFAPVALRNPKPVSLFSDEELGTDAINLEQGWFTSDYLNVFYTLTLNPSSDKPHTVDLAFDDVRSSSDTLYFELRHNGFGEVFDNPELSGKAALASGYVSFPISQLLPGGKSSIPVVISWDWFVRNGDILTADKEHKREVGTYSRQ